ncbi:MAG: polymer-forming cytoskeletal protein [Candidatus Latescibacterota bacterium]|nr:polymer-forming cytoskeletal protein [Candidatus Latescibacterota bacterium]
MSGEIAALLSEKRLVDMLGKKENGALNGSGQTLNTIIGRGTVFEGVMKVDNSVRIDGIFTGELCCSGALTISQSGEAYARLEGKDIYINGTVRGTVRAEKVRLDSQARFIGDVHTGALSVSEGAVFHGNCSMETVASEVKGGQKSDERETGIGPTMDGERAEGERAVAELDSSGDEVHIPSRIVGKAF